MNGSYYGGMTADIKSTECAIVMTTFQVVHTLLFQQIRFLKSGNLYFC